MSIECTMYGCPEPVHAAELCEKHYRRLMRHGDPSKVGAVDCPICRHARRIVNRTFDSTPNNEQLADLWLLFNAGSSFRLTSVDEEGREYDLEEGLRYESSRR